MDLWVNWYDHFKSIFGFELARRNVVRAARKNAFEVMRDEVIELLMLRAQEILRICCASLVWDNSGGLLPCCVLAVCVTHATIEVYLFLANIVSE